MQQFLYSYLKFQVNKIVIVLIIHFNIIYIISIMAYTSYVLEK